MVKLYYFIVVLDYNYLLLSDKEGSVRIFFCKFKNVLLTYGFNYA